MQTFATDDRKQPRNYAIQEFSILKINYLLTLILQCQSVKTKTKHNKINLTCIN